MNLLRLACLPLVLAWATAQPCRAVDPANTRPSDPVTLTYLANEGVLLHDGGGVKVLIDAPFTESYGRFAVPSDAVLEQIRSAAPPFDGLTCILATHGDTDHIGVADAARHLARDSGCEFFAPAEVCEALRQMPGAEAFRSRLHDARQTGGTTEARLSGLSVLAVPLGHLLRPPTMPAPPYNVAHLFSIGGITFLHTGDMGPQNLEAMRRSGLGARHVDVALVNSYFFAPDTIDAARAILAELNPKLVLLAHLGRKDPKGEAAPILKLTGFPPIVALDSPGRSYGLVRDGAEIRFVEQQGRLP